ncbi:AbrB/MazE/SpoVT family DNA-binding domain-containing protein [Microseira sp. BLCC-F43]|jgi:antitoxin component of MazEF toxin-antitoxin module|uniref:AbrB/MazE/SpoVT family DNA-binding domain-containing protein n=1 Tax=Microseira sp. BLCC-F43 TaxID=3153602 RepID=UPI0035B7FCFD
MALTKLTNSGEVAIPPEIIEWLNLKPGDSIDFAIASDGKVYLQPAKIDVKELSGMLYEEGRKAVSLEEMDAAIAECAGESA